MGAAALSSRAIIGRLYYKIEQGGRQSWVPRVTRMFKTDQASETYNWLGQSPKLREWKGERLAKGLRENGLTITNKLFEATLDVDVQELRRDKTGQVMARVDDLGARANQHWAVLCSDFINNGHIGTGPGLLAYDGQFFYDTDHKDPGAENQTNQDNDLTSDISTLPVAQHGSTTAPSVGEMSLSILAAIQAILGFKDDVSEPINDMVTNFLIMVPTNLYAVTASAITAQFVDGNQSNPIKGSALTLIPQINSRLTATDTFFVFRMDGPVGALIRQVEVDNQGGQDASDADSEADVIVSAIAEGSEEEMKFHRHLYGIEASRNVGYGYWQYSCRQQLI